MEQPQSPGNLDTASISSDNSSTFSECNSDISGEFSSTSASSSRHLFLTCCTTSENFESFITQLINDIHSNSITHQKQAVMQIRLLSKHSPDNRIKIARAGAIAPLIALLSSTQDSQLQEYTVTAILNLSLCTKNKEMLMSSCGGRAVRALVHALREGNSTTKENSACALLRLSEIEENKAVIGRSGAIPLLVDLLETGGIRGKKDASTALYSLCSVKENKVRAVNAGVVRVLVELMADIESKMVDKCACVMSLLVSVKEGRGKVVEEGGIPVLVEIVEVGTQRQKEIAAAILLQICQDCSAYRVMVGREGAVPPLVELCQSGTKRAKQKVETLIELLRQPRRGIDDVVGRTSDVSL